MEKTLKIELASREEIIPVRKPDLNFERPKRKKAQIYFLLVELPSVLYRYLLEFSQTDAAMALLWVRVRLIEGPVHLNADVVPDIAALL